MSEILNIAKDLLRMGIATIPVPYMQKAPVIAWKKYQEELPSENDLMRWFGNGRQTNYAVITGWQGLTVLDFDDIEGYTRWLFWTSNTGEDARVIGKHTYRVQTARGMHVYIRLPQGIKSRKIGMIDVQSNNKIVIGAGSVHPSGAIYTAIRPMMIMRVNSLSDILPVEMLVSDTELPPHVVKPAFAPPAPALDPWLTAANPVIKSDLHTVERIKESRKIEDMFSDKVVTGQHYVMPHCPLPDDEHYSMWIDTGKQICGCFACSFEKPFDVINLTARMYGLSNTEAIQVLGRGI